MSNLISEAEKLYYASAIKDLHDTFSKEITVWQRSSQEIVSEDDSYDAFYDKKKSDVIYSSQSRVIKARTKHLDRQDKEFALAINSAANQINVTQEFDVVRIKVDNSDSEYVRDAEKVTIENKDYSVITVPRPHGLFETNYDTFYLRSLV